MPVYTVTQVARYLHDSFEQDNTLSDLWVSGEVSNFKRSAAGHCYFTLKDPASQLRCVMFRPNGGSEALQNGVAVTAHGRVSFYQQQGDLQFYADMVQPEGVGALHLQFLALKAKLEAEGLFDPARKRPLPAFPHNIAVITSRTGAVLHDIKRIVARRYSLAQLLLVHTPVQGSEATDGIVWAFHTLNLRTDIDVVVLARGGGSIEELWPFNEERVARAIYSSRAPVVSAVGHETDFTIADFVADRRAPTPSAAAEMVVPSAVELKERIAAISHAIDHDFSRLLDLRRGEVGHAANRLRMLAPDVDLHRQRVDDLVVKASTLLANQIAIAREQSNSRTQRLAALSPAGTLGRGYAIVQRAATGFPISRVAQARPGDGIVVQVSDGHFKGQVAGGKSLKERRTAVPSKQAPLWP